MEVLLTIFVIGRDGGEGEREGGVDSRVGGKKKQSGVVHELSGKFERGGRGYHIMHVNGVLAGDEMIEQLSRSTISFSTIPKLSIYREREKTKTNIVGTNKISAASTISSYTDISTTKKSQSGVSNGSNVWTNQRRASVKGKRKAEDSGRQRNTKYPRFSSYFDQ